MDGDILGVYQWAMSDYSFTQVYYTTYTTTMDIMMQVEQIQVNACRHGLYYLKNVCKSLYSGRMVFQHHTDTKSNSL